MTPIFKEKDMYMGEDYRLTFKLQTLDSEGNPSDIKTNFSLIDPLVLGSRIALPLNQELREYWKTENFLDYEFQIDYIFTNNFIFSIEINKL